MDGLALDDGTVSAQLAERPRKPWRTHGVGASEIGKLYLALGRRDPDMVPTPAWMRDETKGMKRHGNVSRFLLEKAGVVAKKARSTAALSGTKREPELFAAWLEKLRDGDYGHDFEALLDPDSVGYAMATPHEYPPLLDRDEPKLNCRPDAWARDALGSLVNVQLKCTWKQHPSQRGKQPWWDVEPPWYYGLQVQAESAIVRARSSLLVVGVAWAKDEDDDEPDGPIRVFHIQRDDAVVQDIRDAVREGWGRIVELRERFEKAQEAA